MLAGKVLEDVQNQQPQQQQMDFGPIIALVIGLFAAIPLVAILANLASGGTTLSSSDGTPPSAPGDPALVPEEPAVNIPPSSEKPVIPNLTVTTVDSTKHEVMDIAYPSDGSDVALIQVREAFEGIRPMTISGGDAEIGEQVTQYGQGPDTVTRVAGGVVAAKTSFHNVVATTNPVRVMDEPFPVINLLLGGGDQTSIAGDSGGPVSRSGSEEVIAVHSLRIKDAVVYGGAEYVDKGLFRF